MVGKEHSQQVLGHSLSNIFYLILWDIINSDYNQILSDINRGHITAEDIQKIIAYVESFNNEIISEYWKERLTC